MKTFLLVFMFVFISCDLSLDDPGPPKPPEPDNKLDATITFLPSGDTKQFSARGSAVSLGGCNAWGTHVNAEASSMSIHTEGINSGFCINGPGTYYFSFEFRTSSVVYKTSASKHHGSITYTKVGSYVEGSFEGVCVGTGLTPTQVLDSVSVKGTFSGYLK